MMEVFKKSPPMDFFCRDACKDENSTSFNLNLIQNYFKDQVEIEIH